MVCSNIFFQKDASRGLISGRFSGSALPAGPKHSYRESTTSKMLLEWTTIIDYFCACDPYINSLNISFSNLTEFLSVVSNLFKCIWVLFCSFKFVNNTIVCLKPIDDRPVPQSHAASGATFLVFPPPSWTFYVSPTLPFNASPATTRLLWTLNKPLGHLANHLRRPQ